jgi:hypothetical protein
VPFASIPIRVFHSFTFLCSPVAGAAPLSTPSLAMLSSLKRTVEGLFGWGASAPAAEPPPSPRSTRTRHRGPAPAPTAAPPVLSDAPPPSSGVSYAGQGVPRPSHVDADGDEADGFFDETGAALPAARRAG